MNQVDFDTHLADIVTVASSNKILRLNASGLFNQQGYILPTLINGWEDYGGGYLKAAYFKDTMGVVHFTGLIKSGTIGTIAFVLPAGYRPAATCQFPVTSVGAFGYVEVYADGRVYVAIGNTESMSLAGISFLSE